MLGRGPCVTCALFPLLYLTFFSPCPVFRFGATAQDRKKSAVGKALLQHSPCLHTMSRAQPSQTLFLPELPSDITDGVLERHFRGFVGYESCRTRNDRNGKLVGFVGGASACAQRRMLEPAGPTSRGGEATRPNAAALTRGVGHGIARGVNGIRQRVLDLKVGASTN